MGHVDEFKRLMQLQNYKDALSAYAGVMQQESAGRSDLDELRTDCIKCFDKLGEYPMLRRLKIPTAKLGVAVIFNVELGRPGAEIDTGMIQEAFARDFDVKTFRNPSWVDMEEFICDYEEDSDCFVCFVGAHGVHVQHSGESISFPMAVITSEKTTGDKVILKANDIGLHFLVIETNEVIDSEERNRMKLVPRLVPVQALMKCLQENDALKGKPKVVILNMCRLPSDSHEISLPKETMELKDMLVVFATGLGEKAMRVPQKGSWFVSALTKGLREGREDEVGHILVDGANMHLKEFGPQEQVIYMLSTPNRGKLYWRKGVSIAPFVPRAIHKLPADPNAQFRGREKEMKRMEEMLAESRKLCIWGMAGMGKSQLALEFAHTQKKRYTQMFWVDGGSMATLRANFIHLAEMLGVVIPGNTAQEKREEKQLELLKLKLLDAKEPTLLVLDDVLDSPELSDLMPVGDSCHLILTTRIQGGIMGIKGLELGILAEDDAMELAKGGRNFNKEELEALVKVCAMVEFLTLALAIINSLMARGRMPSDLLKRLRQNQGFLPRGNVPGYKGPISLDRLFDASFEFLKTCNDVEEEVKVCAADMALLGGWFSPSPIRRQVMSSALRKFWETNQMASGISTAGGSSYDVVLEDAADLLVEFNLARRLAGGVSISFHPLVQMYERLQVRGQQAGWAVVLSLGEKPANVELQEDVAHFREACDWVMPTAAMPVLEGDENSVVLVVEKVGLPLAYRMYQTGEGLGLVERCFEKLKGKEGELIWGKGCHTKARILRMQGKLMEAKPLFEHSLTIVRSVCGEESATYGIFLGNYAGLLEAQGNLPDTEALCKRALEIQFKALGENHEQYGNTLGNLAGLLRKQGRLVESENLCRRALEIQERVLGKEHEHYGTALGNLAGLLVAQGKLLDAETLYKRALEIKGRALGEKHAEYGIMLANLASLVFRQGKLAEAEKLYLQAEKILGQALGKEHAWYGLCIGNYAGLLEAQGKLQEAETLHWSALEIKRQGCGENHPEYGIALANYAGILEKQGKLEQALKLYDSAQKICGRALGEEHTVYSMILDHIAGLLSKQGQLKDAEPMYRRALKIKEQALGKKHVECGITLGNLAGLLEAKGEPLEAEQLYWQSLKIKAQALGKEHMEYRTTLGKLAGLLERQGKPGDAEMILQCMLEEEKLAVLSVGAAPPREVSP